MATHSSTLAWKIPWTEEPGRLQSMGSLRVGHDWSTSLSLFTFMHWRRKWQHTPMFILAWRIPGTGEPGGLPATGSHRVGHNWKDFAATTISEKSANLSWHFAQQKCHTSVVTKWKPKIPLKIYIYFTVKQQKNENHARNHILTSMWIWQIGLFPT